VVEAGETIEYAATGERITFRETAADTGGEALVLESFLPPHAPGLRLHVHPGQEERLQVLGGRLAVRVDGRTTVVGPGGRVTVPAGSPHAYRNVGDAPVHLVAEIRPALGLESFLDQHCRVDGGGARRLLQLAVVAHAHFDTVRLHRPHRLIQRAVLSVAAPLGRALGLALHDIQGGNA
jgi:quercetin dioxygenase-like cupin family protein